MCVLIYGGEKKNPYSFSLKYGVFSPTYGLLIRAIAPDNEGLKLQSKFSPFKVPQSCNPLLLSTS